MKADSDLCAKWKNMRRTQRLMDKLPAKKKLQQQLGAYIKHLRRQQRLSQAELAERMRVNVAWIQQVEYGHIMLSCQYLLDVCKALGQEPGCFLTQAQTGRWA
jgi:ribosome-binding protein aMBF1 (putative translation factor)